ncbi:hypothetical protein CEUSTIGMA_g11979.t1 [Chlamydomonas eustigma]|uniref:Retrovirus-related Pol polyprotein from transposon TNT 1-94-like beta-barrel domain-containing protein n=1 Tax=Chlamydomonas eustigma TaxID=1157962 RepID=A0A250XNB6_9CHLO|nr:hypothetical protein CEUSTIGMA_g11979.t1 [Chlamydomonas eustigma]|eukprot:GAX84558.1 hypothetical protein CEUSTIGMA_g11979.t1 [Chlamydomonas eustigma]
MELVGEKKSLTSVLEKIIRNLPSSFDVWAEVERERSRHDAYNIADFWASLRRKDADLSSKSAHDSAGTRLGAFTVRKQHESSVRHSGGHNTSHQAQHQRDGATVTCNHFGRMGHMRAECRSRLVGRAPAPGSVDSKRKHNGGSTHTNTPVRECIHEFVSASRPYSIVRDAGGNEHEVRGHGKVIMKVVLPNNEQTTLTMTEVNYVPTFTCNLSSWKRANMKYESRGDSKGVGWYLNGKLQFYGAWGTTSPVLKGYPILPQQTSACHYSATAENQSDTIKHLHEVCGHRSVHQLQHALKSNTLKNMSDSVELNIGIESQLPDLL